jgi:hypothetical protein
MIAQQITDAELAKRDNAVLDGAGLYDCRVTIGVYKKGNANFDYEARLVGGSNASREKAKSLLPHITFSE